MVVSRDPDFWYVESMPDVPVERPAVGAMSLATGSRGKPFLPYVWQHPSNRILPGFLDEPVLEVAPEPPKPKPKRRPKPKRKPKPKPTPRPWHVVPPVPEPRPEPPAPPTYRVTPGTARPSPGWRAANGEDIESWLDETDAADESATTGGASTTAASC